MRIAYGLAFALCLLSLRVSNACIWDSQTLEEEEKRSPDLADVILGTNHEIPNYQDLYARIDHLKEQPRPNDVDWMNDLAGAYIRIGKPEWAIELLEPARTRFPADYGIHANLGTAYHLQRRFKEAEAEIARDLEINPKGHFGKEKYHLALLQYLMQDEEYQATHLYVDEYTGTMFSTNDADLIQWVRRDVQTNHVSATPAYRNNWNLATDTNFDAGVIYMARMNPREPSCFVMLGVACLRNGYWHRDLHLAKQAFRQAIDLGSPQQKVLDQQVAFIEEHLRHAEGNHNSMIILTTLGMGILMILAVLVIWRLYREGARVTPVPKT